METGTLSSTLNLIESKLASGAGCNCQQADAAADTVTTIAEISDMLEVLALTAAVESASDKSAPREMTTISWELNKLAQRTRRVSQHIIQ